MRYFIAFDSYTDSEQCRANSASNALNKWLQSKFREDIFIHGFRHALRDCLKALQCPSEIMVGTFLRTHTSLRRPRQLNSMEPKGQGRQVSQQEISLWST